LKLAQRTFDASSELLPCLDYFVEASQFFRRLFSFRLPGTYLSDNPVDQVRRQQGKILIPLRYLGVQLADAFGLPAAFSREILLCLAGLMDHIRPQPGDAFGIGETFADQLGHFLQNQFLIGLILSARPRTVADVGMTDVTTIRVRAGAAVMRAGMTYQPFAAIAAMEQPG
jgi:hypothetical protein